MEDSSFQGEFVLNFLGQVWQRFIYSYTFGKACMFLELPDMLMKVEKVISEMGGDMPL